MERDSFGANIRENHIRERVIGKRSDLMVGDGRWGGGKKSQRKEAGVPRSRG